MGTGSMQASNSEGTTEPSCAVHIVHIYRKRSSNIMSARARRWRLGVRQVAPAGWAGPPLHAPSHVFRQSEAAVTISEKNTISALSARFFLKRCQNVTMPVATDCLTSSCNGSRAAAAGADVKMTAHAMQLLVPAGWRPGHARTRGQKQARDATRLPPPNQAGGGHDGCAHNRLRQRPRRAYLDALQVALDGGQPAIDGGEPAVHLLQLLQVREQEIRAVKE